MHCDSAGSPERALDLTLTFASSAWSMCAWFWLLVSRDDIARRQLARQANPAQVSFDQESFAALMSEQCEGLMLCFDIGSNPHKLHTMSTGAGWIVTVRADGEDEVIDLDRLAGVIAHWRTFERAYLRNIPTAQLAAMRLPPHRTIRRNGNGAPCYRAGLSARPCYKW